MKKVVKSIFMVLFTCFTMVLFAQQQLEDVVYLRNGSIIRGKIIKQTADSVKIETNCYNVFAFTPAEVLEIKQEAPKIKAVPVKEGFNSDKKKGLYNYSTLGMLAGNSEMIDTYTFCFQTQFGYEFSHLFGLGAGIGIEHLKTELLPVFIAIKSHLLNKPGSPFVQLTTGYSFPLSTTKTIDSRDFTYSGGYNFGFDFGICYWANNRRAFTVTVGYRYQQVKENSPMYYLYPYGETIEHYTYEFNKIAVKIGFLFR